MFLGLRTIIYPAQNLAASRDWFAEVLNIEPYFNEAFYVGFDVAGYELALDPNADPDVGPITYWGVTDAAAAHGGLLEAGATSDTEVRDVGDGIRVATVRGPEGQLIGIIENPHFQPHQPLMATPGPGR